MTSHYLLFAYFNLISYLFYLSIFDPKTHDVC